MTWGVTAAAVAAAGTVGGAAISADAARKAANQQSNAANAANQLSQNQYNDSVARNQPFVSGGTTAFNSLLDRLGLSGNTSAPGYGTFGQTPTADQVMATPGYQFGLDQGQLAISRQMRAQGLAGGGAAVKAASQYGTNYATGQYQNAFNNMLNSNQQNYNQLFGVAGMGQSSANSTNFTGMMSAANQGNNLMGAANAQGAATIGSANAWTNALNQGVSSYLSQQHAAPGSAPTGGYGGWNPYSPGYIIPGH